MTVRRGTYALLIALGSDAVLDVGALGEVPFLSGYYCYVGSAMGGLDQRVSRHISKEKKVRWHVDRLTKAADSVEAYESYPDYVPECELARMAQEAGMEPVVAGFGCSDCRCRTHLFRTDEASFSEFLRMAGLAPFERRWSGRKVSEKTTRIAAERQSGVLADISYLNIIRN